MENKYYTPDIEDIHVGYECELYQPIDINEEKFDWIPTIIKQDEINYPDWKNPFSSKIRVPYLTKEQIETEGWQLDYTLGDFDYYVKTYNDGEYELEFCYKQDISINRTKYFLYIGTCPSINEFRKIIKLLGI